MRLLGTCVALDMNGRRCRRAAVRAIKYHGDSELYGAYNTTNGPGWVRAELCDKHSRKPNRNLRRALRSRP